MRRGRGHSAGVDQADDDQVYQRGGEGQSLDRAQVVVEVRPNDLRPHEQDDVEQQVRRQQEEGEPQLPSNEGVRGHRDDGERREQRRDAREQVPDVMRHGREGP